MTTYFSKLIVVAAALISLLAYSPLARAEDPPSVDKAYGDIKLAERDIPVPGPVQTINVGTFNAATGTFEGLTTEIEIINGKPVRLVPSVSINAVNAKLVFSIVNSTKLVHVGVRGVGSTAVIAGRSSIAIDIGRTRSANWTISSGTKSHIDELTIKRPAIIGGGAFTIPALPVAVVYDPPQNSAHTNSVVYTRTLSMGTTLGLSVRNSASTTAPAVNPTFSGVESFQSTVDGLKTVVSAAGHPLIASALGKIHDSVGSVSRNVTTATDNLSTSRRTYSFAEAHGCQLLPGIPHLGPGRSDMIDYLRNVRVVWVDNGTSTRMLILGTGPRECATIDDLRSGLTGLPAAAVAGLIALDPFAGSLGGKTPLGTNPRYISKNGIGLLPDVLNTATYTQQEVFDSSSVETSTKVVVDDLSPGVLSIIGVGPTESKKVSSSLSISNSADTTQATTVSTALTATTLIDGARSELAVFYDRTFGTVAFQDATP
jgi:hypothetical protein